MSHKPRHHTSQKHTTASGSFTSIPWPAFEAYNTLSAPERSAALASLGILDTDKSVLGILTKSHFVIPGKTRFECQQCGECCRYARKVAQLTYEPCPFLTADNNCAKHDNRYIVCKWFPFWVYNHSLHGPMLTIKPYCTGFGSGPQVPYVETLERIQRLAREETREADGAFVIHEVLMIPGRKDWAFPSKQNVDELMAYIRRESMKSSAQTTSGTPLERDGEVHYAHHYTSGLLGSIGDPLFTVNEKGLVTDVNQSGCDLLGRARAHIVGSPFPSFFINPDRVTASVRACFSQGRETASPHRLRLPDESAVPVLLNSLVFRDRSDGLVHGLLVCVNRVSAAVFADVNQSRTYARGLLEASLDALMVIDRDGAITDVNETVSTMTGRGRDTLLGLPFKVLFVDGDKAQRGVETTFRDGTVKGFDLLLVNLSGERIPVSFNATVYRDSDGVIQGIFAAARDIRERLKMIREIENAKNYARGLIECSPDLMVTISREGTITDANKAASDITGLPREELIGLPFSSCFDDERRATQGVEATFAEGLVRNYELNLITGSGSTTPVSFNASLYRDSQGEVQGVFAIARTK